MPSACGWDLIVDSVFRIAGESEIIADIDVALETDGKIGVSKRL